MLFCFLNTSIHLVYTFGQVRLKAVPICIMSKILHYYILIETAYTISMLVKSEAIFPPEHISCSPTLLHDGPSHHTVGWL